MPITVADTLRASGLTDDQIKALDAKVLGAFETVVTGASQTLEQAELARRAQEAMYAEQIAPALDKWGNEKATLEAQVAFYRTQNEAARTGGFVPSDAPGYQPPQGRNQDGTFVAGANAVPGSPDLVAQVRQELGGAFSDSIWAMQEYQRLNAGAFLPEDITALAQEATRQRLPFRDYVSRKFDFDGRRTALKAEEQKKHDDAIRAETAAAKDREYSERYGNNPNFRAAEPSKFSNLDRAVKEGTRPDPTSLSKEQRHATTRNAIQAEIREQATNTVQ